MLNVKPLTTTQCHVGLLALRAFLAGLKTMPTDADLQTAVNRCSQVPADPLLAMFDTCHSDFVSSQENLQPIVPVEMPLKTTSVC